MALRRMDLSRGSVGKASVVKKALQVSKPWNVCLTEASHETLYCQCGQFLDGHLPQVNGGPPQILETVIECPGPGKLGQSVYHNSTRTYLRLFAFPVCRQSGKLRLAKLKAHVVPAMLDGGPNCMETWIR